METNNELLSIETLIKAATGLQKAIDLHKYHANFYSELFNRVAAAQPDLLTVTPMMAIYQDAAVYHITCWKKAEVAYAQMNKGSEKAILD